jgi:antibiotic biosynthesis monooxygenase (ABM) superfamily enzyme
MSHSTAGIPHPSMEVRGSWASSVIVHRVPPDGAEGFMQWQRGITGVAERFPGYRGTDLYPPAEDRRAEWVAVIHFDGPEHLGRWLDSPERSEWTAKLPGEAGSFRLKTLPTGFGTWFDGLVGEPEPGLPPSWKMALTVLLGLYPTVMLLGIFVGPYTSAYGLALSMLIGNALSISTLQWAVMPVLNTLLGPWLHAKPDGGKALSIGGLALILLLLGALAFLFHRVTG